VLLALGAAMLVPLALTLPLASLRRHIPEFLAIYFAAFALYAVATTVALRQPTLSNRGLVAAFALAAAMMALLVLSRPTLSDDMYRYVWDGRVQAQGLSPYVLPPNAAELASLRDNSVWIHINRKGSFTIYPPAAQLAFAILWRVRPDSVRWFQLAMAAGALVAGGLLVGLLRDLNLSRARAIIFLWSPLLAFETAHGAHLDGLVLPFVVGAWWARVRQRDALVGILLGVATAMKLYPAMLFPALWRPGDRRGRWTMPLAFGLTLAGCYLPYVLTSGPQVLGFLPKYFGERFNMGLAGLLIPVLEAVDVDPDRGLLGLALAVLLALGIGMILRPASSGEAAVRRSIWLIGAFTLLTQNLFPWYMLWLLPLLALFVQPGRLLGLRADAWTGWWLFCGLIALSYTFFLSWRPVAPAIWAQYLPLYALLAVDAGRALRSRRTGWNWFRPRGTQHADA
jgi:hypothetical protein